MSTDTQDWEDNLGQAMNAILDAIPEAATEAAISVLGIDDAECEDDDLEHIQGLVLDQAVFASRVAGRPGVQAALEQLRKQGHPLLELATAYVQGPWDLVKPGPAAKDGRATLVSLTGGPTRTVDLPVAGDLDPEVELLCRFVTTPDCAGALPIGVITPAFDDLPEELVETLAWGHEERPLALDLLRRLICTVEVALIDVDEDTSEEEIEARIASRLAALTEAQKPAKPAPRRR